LIFPGLGFLVQGRGKEAFATFFWNLPFLLVLFWMTSALGFDTLNPFARFGSLDEVDKILLSVSIIALAGYLMWFEFNRVMRVATWDRKS
jgi:hypothetical protein